ncbi:MAG: hypothetical protein HY645_05800 [Acidobacteria bacterium]|nr:hypothetical protein [Acidobacteriota bacterium]
MTHGMIGAGTQLISESLLRQYFLIEPPGVLPYDNHRLMNLRNWLYWYLPWGHLDWILRLEIVIWMITVFASLLIWFFTVILRRKWLRLQHLRAAASISPTTAAPKRVASRE